MLRLSVRVILGEKPAWLEISTILYPSNVLIFSLAAGLIHKISSQTALLQKHMTIVLEAARNRTLILLSREVALYITACVERTFAMEPFLCNNLRHRPLTIFQK